MSVKDSQILRECPFCGSVRAPEVSDVGECEECTNFDYCLRRQENHTCEGCDEWERPMFVVCNYNISGCGVSGPYRKTKAEAIAAWNSRAERTCRNVSTTNNFRCSECDAADLDFDKPSYCHGCGAKVVGV